MRGSFMKSKVLFVVCTMLAGLTVFGCAKAENSESMERSQMESGEGAKETEEVLLCQDLVQIKMRSSAS